jgi:hypothetical protein
MAKSVKIGVAGKSSLINGELFLVFTEGKEFDSQIANALNLNLEVEKTKVKV